VFTDIQNVLFVDAGEVEGYVLEFFVLGVVVEWQDRDSVVDIEGETKTVIVKYKNVF